MVWWSRYPVLEKCRQGDSGMGVELTIQTLEVKEMDKGLKGLCGNRRDLIYKKETRTLQVFHESCLGLCIVHEPTRVIEFGP